MTLLQPAFGDLIRDARLAGERTQAQFGELLGGVTRSAVSAWERGTSFPRPRFLERIADVTGHSPDELAHMFFPVRIIHVIAYRWQCSICDRSGPVLTGDAAKRNCEAEAVRHSKSHQQRGLHGGSAAGDLEQ